MKSSPRSTTQTTDEVEKGACGWTFSDVSKPFYEKVEETVRLRIPIWHKTLMYVYYTSYELKQRYCLPIPPLLWFLHYNLHIIYHCFLPLFCQQSSLPLHLHQRLSRRRQETPSTWSAALRAAPTAPWVTWWPGPASHLRAGRRSSNRRPPSRPRPLSSWTASTSVWETRSDEEAAVV